MKFGLIITERGKRPVFPWKDKLVDVLDFAERQGISVPAADAEKFIKTEGTVPFLRRLWDILEEPDEDLLYEKEKVKFLPPVPSPEKIICLGRNYIDHCQEQGKEPPENPVIFAKYRNALIGHRGKIILPRSSRMVDYEAELVVVIGKGGKGIEPAEAYKHILGYAVGNDVSARDCQFGDGQWVRGKTFDTFLPLGPFITTADQVEDPHSLHIKLDLNGKPMQDSSTSKMVFPVDYIISFISKDITLSPGDIICTGTPAGVGFFRKPQVFLKEGDQIRIEIERVGVLENFVVLPEVPSV